MVELALELPAYGQNRIANEVLKRYALKVSPQGVRSIWLRHDLQTMTKRLKALQAQSAQQGLVLTDAQLVALERAKREKRPRASLRPNVLATAARRIRSMSATSKA